MMKIRLLSILLVSVLLIPILASAAETDQRTIFATIEKGKHFRFSMFLENVAQDESIRVTGDASEWFSWGEIPRPSGYLTFSIDVPDNTDTGSYFAEIKANEDVLSMVSVAVTASVPENTINDMRDQVDEIRSKVNSIQSKEEDLDDRIIQLSNTLKEIRNDLNRFSDTLKSIDSNQRRVNEVEEQYKDDIAKLEGEVSTLENTKRDLEVKNEETLSITGRVIANWSSVAFAIGLIAGIVAVILYTRNPRMQRFFEKTKIRNPLGHLSGIRLGRFKRKKQSGYTYRP